MNLEQAAVGILSQIHGEVRDLRDSLERGRTWGVASDPDKVTWAANETAEYNFDGTFAAVGIFNLSAATIRVALIPNGAARDQTALLTLSARGFIVLPVRGATVSVGGTAGGDALIVPCREPQPLNAGTF